ncbi:hypothetical protein QP168_09440 [Aerococcus urinae]|uniref:Uncharacterized protein n=1 Tax=Aerococcus mictus TaxID=2976810 RepID=A0A1E9PGM3_9LACT|nr:MULTISPECIES: hypothetical protein [Aerococcus]KAA9291234.1 hypothetical protein F6I06_06190 [Aerococcus mictus]MBU5611156.1 hypothetical protein [Aerococcus urinae]MCY3064935.1 hypothetical protein [Aerococcus mictus]MCY3077342.1 hypothetical protein [Aerococcus mictus]MCY3081441.1 hypothetical protein [Aerococcus mictus]
MGKKIPDTDKNVSPLAKGEWVTIKVNGAEELSKLVDKAARLSQELSETIEEIENVKFEFEFE